MPKMQVVCSRCGFCYELGGSHACLDVTACPVNPATIPAL